MNIANEGLAMLHFEEARHRFTVNGQWLPSVKKVVERYVKPFDKDHWSAYVARKRGVTQEEVLAEWAAKATESRDMGQEVHDAIRATMVYGLGSPEHLGVTMRPEAQVRFDMWERHVLPRIRGPAFINLLPAVEYPVWHKELGYAGIKDLLAVTTHGLWLFDWKTNSHFNEGNKYGDTLLEPFNELPACEFTEYSLQTSALRMCLESHDVPVAGAALVWLGPGGALRMKQPLDLRDRLAADLSERPMQ